MNLSQIKKKYKDILEDSDGSSSSGDFTNTMESVNKGFPNKHKRTQSAANKENSVTKQKQFQVSLHTEIIHLKQRLGQANQKLERKDNELKSQCDQKGEVTQQKRILQKHLSNFQEQIQRRDRQLVELKAHKIGYDNHLRQLRQESSDKELDTVILKKQIEFYEGQQKKFRIIIKQKDDQISALTSKNKGVTVVRSENQRLKNDINRLIMLLEDKKGSKCVKPNSSYMGKPQRTEGDNWYNRDLIGVAQKFLRKHTIPEKNVLPELVKMLSSIQSSAKSAKSVDPKRHRNSSQTYKQTSITLPRYSISSKIQGCENSQSMFYSRQRIQQNTFNHTIQDEGKIFNCRELIAQYKNNFDQLLGKKVFSRSKLRGLADWLVISIDNLIKQAGTQP